MDDARLKTSFADVPERYRWIHASDWDAIERGAELLPFDSIELDRQGCYGICPVYTVTFERSGLARLSAKRGLPQVGIFYGRIDVLTYGRLSYAIEQLDFASMNGRWPMSIDADTAVVTVTSNAGPKRLEDSGQSGPIGLWSIEQIIDAIRSDIVWIPLDTLRADSSADPCLWDHATTATQTYFRPLGRTQFRPVAASDPQGGPRLTVSDLDNFGTIDFGAVPERESFEHRFRVGNSGDQPLIIWEAETGWEGFSVTIGGRILADRSPAPRPLTLAPGEDTWLVLHYVYPRLFASYYHCRSISGWIEIVSNDPRFEPYLSKDSGKFEARLRFVVEPRPQNARQLATLEAMPTPTTTPAIEP